VTETGENLEHFKKLAALEAVKFVKSGMTVGLGTGSTAKYAIEEIGRLMAERKLMDIIGVPTSIASEKLAQEVGIPLMELAPAGVDIAIDGADEIDPNLELIKGMGGALVREKLVEFNAKRFIVVADHTKIVPYLGYKTPVPVEIMRWGYRATINQLASVAPQLEARLWMKDGEPVITDNGNYLVSCSVKEILNPRDLDAKLRYVPGVIGTGLFVGYANLAFVAGAQGVERFSR
jgi:ribose 5-phosphate isomerase A